MNALNDGFFLVTDKIIQLQRFFMKEAWSIGAIVFFISIISAAINYGITGEGLKNNVIKIGKALVFFIVIMNVYPWIISHLVLWTFTKARDSTFTSGVIQELQNSRAQVISVAEATRDAFAKKEGTAVISVPYRPISQPTFGNGSSAIYGNTGTTGGTQVTIPTNNNIEKTLYDKKISEMGNPEDFFPPDFPRGMLIFRTLTDNKGNTTSSYWAVAPAGAMNAVLIIAKQCLHASDTAPQEKSFPDFGMIIKSLFCALAVMLTGVFAVLEYLIAFIEYMFVTSVGIILFPLSLWEGSKFMAEKLISAIIGFFIKLLFSTVCIFLMLYGFYSLAARMAVSGFHAQAEEIAIILFASLMYFYLCKSAPGLAQSLLTGSPSLSATGAISAIGGAVGAAIGIGGAAKAIGGTVAGGAAKTAFAGAGAFSQAGGAIQAASGAVAAAGGSKLQQFGIGLSAGMGSLKASAGEGMSAGVWGLSRSLLGDGSRRSGGSTGSNPHSQLAQYLANPNSTMKDYVQGRKETGEDMGKYTAFQKGIPLRQRTN